MKPMQMLALSWKRPAAMTSIAKYAYPGFLEIMKHQRPIHVLIRLHDENQRASFVYWSAFVYRLFGCLQIRATARQKEQATKSTHNDRTAKKTSTLIRYIR